jgi:hypothetical protein
MPYLTRITIRLAMLYLILGITAWTLYWIDLTWEISVNLSALKPIGIHFITIGWLTQLIFAVIYWMFPIISRDNPRGDVWIAWFGLGALNLGLIFRAIFEFGLTQGMPQNVGWGLVGAGLLQWSGATAWIIVNWGRVRKTGANR